MRSWQTWTWWVDHERTVTIVVVGIAAFWIAACAFRAQPYRFVVNTTASEPEGLYLVERLDQSQTLALGQLVSFRYQQPWHIPPYTEYPSGMHFLKRIVAIPGMEVVTRGRCQYRLADGAFPDKLLGCAITETPSGIPVPNYAHLSGVISSGFFYMQGDGKDSYDSRYYGLVPRERILGTAKLIWPW